MLILTSKKIFEKQKLNFSRSALFHMKTRLTLKCFVNDGLWKVLLASISSKTPPNLISLTILVTLTPIFSMRTKIGI